jgi:hypothetical protein
VQKLLTPLFCPVLIRYLSEPTVENRLALLGRFGRDQAPEQISQGVCRER